MFLNIENITVTIGSVTSKLTKVIHRAVFPNNEESITK